MKGYTIKYMSEYFKRSTSTIRNVLSAMKYNYIYKDKKEEYFSIDAFNFLKNKYKPLVEVIEVPVYKNVYWEIIPSKMNFE